MKTGKISLTLAAALLALAGQAATAATISVVPTGTTADFAAVQAAIDSATPGDVIVLENRNAGNAPTAFNFTTMTSGGIQVSTPLITIRGIHEEGSPSVTTTIQGPTTFDAGNSMVGFTLNEGARSITMRKLRFETLEAAVVLEEGVEGFSMRRCGVSGCANGVFGVGDNDNMWIDGCIMSITSTPLGGNGGVTVQEGSDKLTVVNNRFKGPGVGAASVASSGIIDFNLASPAAAGLIANNNIKEFDAGIYVSSALTEIHGNVTRLCADGIALVSEIDSASTQGTQMVANNNVTFNVSKDNTNDGIDLEGVLASVVADNSLSNNGDNDIRCGSSTLGTGAANNILKRNTGTENCSVATLTTANAGKPKVKVVRP